MGTAEVETVEVEPAEIVKDDPQGAQQGLGFREGATETAEFARDLLEDLGARGVSPFRRRLLVIDGSQGLRKAVDLVFGGNNPVQLCRNHKLRNGLGHLPKDQHEQARATLKAAFQRGANAGESKLEGYAGWLEWDCPNAGGALREGLGELFTINGLGLPSKLRRCRGTTIPIDNGRSAVRERTCRVKYWQNATMARRWATTAFDAASNLRQITGYEHLWMLKAALEERTRERQLAQETRAG